MLIIWKIFTCVVYIYIYIYIYSADHLDIIIEHDKISPWWQNIRSACCQATNISSALLAALVSRSVAMEMAQCAMVNMLYI